MRLLTRTEFREIAERVLKRSTGQRTMLAVYDAEAGTTRFANNQLVQHVQSRRTTLAVTVAFGQQHGTAMATDFGEDTLQDLVARAEGIAKLAPPDPEYMPPLRPQEYPALRTADEETILAGPERRVALAAEAIERCRTRALTAAGIVGSSVMVAGLAASTGLFAYEPRTEARFNLTATGPGGTGWAANVHRSIAQLGVAERTRMAIENATRATTTRELPAGRYPVILQPAAVAGLVGPMSWMLDAKSFYKGTSPFLGKLGRVILDRRLSLANRPEHPDLLANGFNAEGLPAADLLWIEHGVLRQLRYDRYTAQEHHVHPTPAFEAPYLWGEGEGSPFEELICDTVRGILVSNFWYIRSVNPTDLTLTGMTRDGTFLIEDGRVTDPLVDLRWHDSPLRALRRVDGYTAPGDAISNEQWKMKVPALKLPEFNFTSVSRL